MRQASSAGRDKPGMEWDAHPARRHASLSAWFNAFVDQHDDLDRIMQQACRVAAVGVRARFAGLLRFRADQRAFVLQSGTGWQEPEAECIRHAADLTTTAGLAWHIGKTIHFRGLSPDGQVRSLELMRAQSVHRVISVPIRGWSGEGFGVLEVGSAVTGEFTRHDASFLQALTSSLATKVGR